MGASRVQNCSGIQNKRNIWYMDKSGKVIQVRKRAHKMLTLPHNHSQAQVMVAPNQPQHFKPETQVQVGHTYGAQPVIVMTISGKIAISIISALSVGQNSMPYMCITPVRNNICIYCGSTQHSSGNCTSQPNDNREKTRSVPWDLLSQGPYYKADTKCLGLP